MALAIRDVREHDLDAVLALNNISVIDVGDKFVTVVQSDQANAAGAAVAVEELPLGGVGGALFGEEGFQALIGEGVVGHLYAGGYG